MSEAPQTPARKPAAEVTDLKKRSGIYAFARGLCNLLFHTISPVRFHNRERVLQLKAPFIYIGNHNSLMDPLILACSLRRDQIHFLGKHELTGNRLLGWLVTRMHMVPVERHGTDMAAMRSCMKVIREGQILGIFPEGTRHHQGNMEELEAGTAMIALRSGVPLIPAYITPKYHLFRMHHCYIGEPIPTEDLRAEGVNNETCQKLLHRITETYARMAAEHEAAVRG